MNLHTITRASIRQTVWVAVSSQNGRTLGIHAYEVDEGAPPEWEPRPSWVREHDPYWTPIRFHWTPYSDSIRNLFRDGYVRPLCGHRSRAESPTARPAQDLNYNCCQDCRNAASQQGKMIFTAIGLSSPAYESLQQEYRTWNANGRADPE